MNSKRRIHLTKRTVQKALPLFNVFVTLRIVWCGIGLDG
jgi:hypothetical protein